MKDYLINSILMIKNIDFLTEKFTRSVANVVSENEFTNFFDFHQWVLNENSDLFNLNKTIHVLVENRGFFSDDVISISEKELLNASSKICECLEAAFSSSIFYEYSKKLKTGTLKEQEIKKYWLSKFGVNVNPRYTSLDKRLALDYLDNIDNSIKNISDFNVTETLIESVDDLFFDDFFYYSKSKVFLKENYSVVNELLKLATNKDDRLNLYSLIHKEGVAKSNNSNKMIAKSIVENNKNFIDESHNSFLEYSLSNNFFKNKNDIFNFIDVLSKDYYEKTIADIILLRKYIKIEHNENNLNSEDLSYYINNYKEAELNKLNVPVSIGLFDIDIVLKNCFKIIEDISGLKFEIKKNKDFIHEDVLYCSVRKKDKEVADIIINLFSEDLFDGEYYYMFKDQFGEKSFSIINLLFLHPKKMSIENIKDLLHELGHAIETILFKKDNVCSSEYLVDYEKDKLEVVSSFLSFYSTDIDFLYKCLTKEERTSIQKTDIQNFIDTDSFFNSYEMCNMFKLSMFDLKAHDNNEYDFEDLELMMKKDFLPLYDSCYNTLVYSFAHCFDDYSCNYYSYLFGAIVGEEIFKTIKQDDKFILKFKHKILTNKNLRNFKSALKDFYGDEIPEKIRFFVK